MNVWWVPVESILCIHLDVHVNDEKTHFSISLQFVCISNFLLIGALLLFLSYFSGQNA